MLILSVNLDRKTGSWSDSKLDRKLFGSGRVGTVSVMRSLVLCLHKYFLCTGIVSHSIVLHCFIHVWISILHKSKNKKMSLYRYMKNDCL